jgi:hypothetical protein
MYTRVLPTGFGPFLNTSHAQIVGPGGSEEWRCGFSTRRATAGGSAGFSTTLSEPEYYACNREVNTLFADLTRLSGSGSGQAALPPVTTDPNGLTAECPEAP